MKVIGPDGREWKVFRRRVAWRPHGSDTMRSLYSFSLSGFGDPITNFVRMLAVLLALPFLLVFLVDSVVMLLVTPFAHLARRSGSRPWPVVARSWKLPEYRGGADTPAAADHLVFRVREEIIHYGDPRSLTPPPGREVNLSTEPENNLPGWARASQEALGRLVDPQRPPPSQPAYPPPPNHPGYPPPPHAGYPPPHHPGYAPPPHDQQYGDR
ncbi:hypothetical protein [Plantactinospora sp. B24E8]|uniref:hypothetical protein n=1 Tax=Plantactinospora sp. B24E8 TaxID=3153567 RepID=UPI00325D0F8A